MALTGSGNPYNQPLTMRDMTKGFTVGGYATTRETNVGKLHLGYAVECYRDDNGNMKHSYLFQPWQYSGFHSIINF